MKDLTDASSTWYSICEISCSIVSVFQRCLPHEAHGHSLSCHVSLARNHFYPSEGFHVPCCLAPTVQDSGSLVNRGCLHECSRATPLCKGLVPKRFTVWSRTSHSRPDGMEIDPLVRQASSPTVRSSASHDHGREMMRTRICPQTRKCFTTIV